MQARQIDLYQTDPSTNTDKAYQLKLMQDPAGSDGWLVWYRNGRRGKPLTAGGAKTSVLPYEKAEAEYNKLILGQKKKGYTEDVNGVAYSDTVMAGRHGGVKVQLLKPITLEQSDDLMKDGGYTWEEKMDGERRPIRKEGDEITGMQRDGLIVPIPTALADAIRAWPIHTCVVDGEDMGNGVYAPFALISTESDPDGKRPYFQRRAELHALMARAPSPLIRQVLFADNPTDAEALLEAVGERMGEGLVAKRKTSGHNEDDHFKLKFIDSATVFVDRLVDTKRSVHVAGLDDAGNVVQLGKVTIPPNRPVPQVGAIVEVQYLYAYRNGSLFQPVFKGERTDRAREHCVTSQLKYKPEDQYNPFDHEAVDEESSAPSM